MLEPVGLYWNGALRRKAALHHQPEIMHNMLH